jgi:hypothetical protein
LESVHGQKEERVAYFGRYAAYYDGAKLIIRDADGKEIDVITGNAYHNLGKLSKHGWLPARKDDGWGNGDALKELRNK